MLKMIRLKNRDKVIVITGRDKGKIGIILKIINKKKKKALVEGINIYRKNVSANPSKGKVGGIIAKEMYIDYSNLAIFNIKLLKKDKIFFKLLKKRKIRMFKSGIGDVTNI